MYLKNLMAVYFFEFVHIMFFVCDCTEKWVKHKKYLEKACNFSKMYSASSLKSKLFEILTVPWFLFHCRETKSSTKFIFCMEIY